MLLGIGRNLPFESIYFFGLGLGDLLFCVLTYLLLLGGAKNQGLRDDYLALRLPLAAIAYLAALAMLSLAFNAPIYDVKTRDIFEILKYFYLAVVMLITSRCTRMSVTTPALGFVVGAIVAGVIAFLNPMNPDVLGTRQIFNPNVIGNVLSVSIVLCSFVILAGRPLTGGALAVIATVISFFTFSKGTWLMTVFGLCACWLALGIPRANRSERAVRYGRWLGYLTFVLLAGATIFFWDTVTTIVQAKIVATEFDASAADGGSFSARVGLIQSALHMFLMNPLLGVGISNFEEVHRTLQPVLGNAFYDDDNPNSAWFYVLACMGLPAFILFTSIFIWFLIRVSRLPAGTHRKRLTYTACVGIVFLTGGNVQVEMLTAYYYWVALGLVAGWTASIDTSRHTLAAGLRLPRLQKLDPAPK